MHKEGGNLTCPNCQKTFTEYPNIRKHIVPFHTDKRFSYTFFINSFTGGDKLKTHMVRHLEAKDFMCEDCGVQCKMKYKLREHGKWIHNALTKKESPGGVHSYIKACNTQNGHFISGFCFRVT